MSEYPWRSDGWARLLWNALLAVPLVVLLARGHWLLALAYFLALSLLNWKARQRR